jgi:hypothetical protein
MSKEKETKEKGKNERRKKLMEGVNVYWWKD